MNKQVYNKSHHILGHLHQQHAGLIVDMGKRSRAVLNAPGKELTIGFQRGIQPNLGCLKYRPVDVWWEEEVVWLERKKFQWSRTWSCYSARDRNLRFRTKQCMERPPQSTACERMWALKGCLINCGTRVTIIKNNSFGFNASVNTHVVITWRVLDGTRGSTAAFEKGSSFFVQTSTIYYH